MPIATCARVLSDFVEFPGPVPVSQPELNCGRRVARGGGSHGF